MGGPATQNSTVDARLDQRTSSAPDGPPTLEPPARAQAGHPAVELGLHGRRRTGSGEHAGDQLEITDTVQHLEAVPGADVEPVSLDEIPLVRGGFTEPHVPYHHRDQVPLRWSYGAGVEVAQHRAVRPGYDVSEMRVTVQHRSREWERQGGHRGGQLRAAAQQETPVGRGHRQGVPHPVVEIGEGIPPWQAPAG